jgi:hypothetical protein
VCELLGGGGGGGGSPLFVGPYLCWFHVGLFVAYACMGLLLSDMIRFRHILFMQNGAISKPLC